MRLAFFFFSLSLFLSPARLYIGTQLNDRSETLLAEGEKSLSFLYIGFSCIMRRSCCERDTADGAEVNWLGEKSGTKLSLGLG